MIRIDATPRWDTERLSSLFVENNERNTDFCEQRAFQFYFGTIVPKKSYELTDSLVETYKKYTVVQPGDIMINGLNLNYDFVTQRVAIVPQKGIITSAYISLRPRADINISYYCYLLKTVDAKKMFHGLGTGIRLTLSFKDIRNLQLPIPPRAEQDQIVRFLDWKVSEINKLITLKKKEIRLILERQSTAISDLVFGRTIDGKKKALKALHNIEVPDTWFVLRNKNLFRERTEHTETGSEMLLSVSRHYGVKPYEALDINEQYATIKPALSLVGYKKVYRDDLAMNIMRAQNGSFGISHYDGIVSPAYCIYKPIRDFDRMYIHYLYRTPEMIHEFSANSYGIVEHRRRLYPESFLRMTTFLPPLSVQHEIVLEIERTIDQFKKGILLLEKQISALQEFKIRIVSDVVTGRVDVRSATIPDYEFVSDESDCIDDDEDTDEDTESQED